MKLGTFIDLWGLANNRYKGIHEKSPERSKLEFLKIAESAFSVILCYEDYCLNVLSVTI